MFVLKRWHFLHNTLTNTASLLALCLSHPTGAKLPITAKITNNGNVRLRNLTLDVDVYFSNVTCMIGTTAFVSGSSTLEPKAVMDCTAEHVVSTSDIEAANTSLPVTVSATSVLGQPVNQTKQVEVKPVSTPNLAITVGTCTPPNMPGKASQPVALDCRTTVVAALCRRGRFPRCMQLYCSTHGACLVVLQETMLLAL